MFLVIFSKFLRADFFRNTSVQLFPSVRFACFVTSLISACMQKNKKIFFDKNSFKWENTPLYFGTFIDAKTFFNLSQVLLK